MAVPRFWTVTSDRAAAGAYQHVTPVLTLAYKVQLLADWLDIGQKPEVLGLRIRPAGLGV